jgi:hypothetical protein
MAATGDVPSEDAARKALDTLLVPEFAQKASAA